MRTTHELRNTTIVLRKATIILRKATENYRLYYTKLQIALHKKTTQVVP